MDKLLWVLAATLIDSLLGFAGIFSLWIKDALLNRIVKILVAFSAGVLLGGAFFHLILESLEQISPYISFIVVLSGFLMFFIFEGYLHSHLCDECEIHPYSYLMIVGDSLHNFIDGLVIAAAFMINISLGLITTLMVMAHELPQELGVFSVLVSGGIKKEKAVIYSFLAQCFCILGGIIGVFAVSRIGTLSGYILPFAAGGFLYIAAADLIPVMHKTAGIQKIYSFFYLVLGVVFMLAAKFVFGL